MKPRTRHRSDYQSDIYDAKVEIAIAKWKSGTVPRDDSRFKEVSHEKC